MDNEPEIGTQDDEVDNEPEIGTHDDDIIEETEEDEAIESIVASVIDETPAVELVDP